MTQPMVLHLSGSGAIIGENNLQPTDRGLLLADGLFETLLYQNQGLAFFSKHYKRLRLGAECLAIPFDVSENQLQNMVLQHIQSRHTSLGPKKTDKPNPETHAIRITLTRGASKTRGITPPSQPAPTLIISTHPYTAPNKSLSLFILENFPITTNLLSQHKTLNYTDHVYAKQQAMEQGFDDAVLLNHKSHVISTTCANIFAKVHGVWTTPKISDGALPGIMRAAVIQEAKEKGGKIIERSITPEELHNAESLFVTTV